MSRFSSIIVHGVGVLALAATGCGGSDDESTGARGPASASAGAGGSAGVSPTSITFEGDPTLTVLPGEARTVEVRATPAAAYEVRFALLGRSLNASLDRSSAHTDERGAVSVVLTAPTEPTVFSLRASIGTTTSAHQTVSVSASGYGTIQILPKYLGSRPVSSWVGSVVTGTRCADLPGTPPPDGTLVNTSLAEHAPRIEKVPVGPILAVTARAAMFAGGCTDVESIDADRITDVVVPVTDRPLQLAETDLSVTLGVDTVDPEWGPAIAEAVSLVTKTMIGGAPDDVTALLDAMSAETATEADRNAFIAARALGGWDDLISAGMGNGSDVIRSSVTDWMTVGASHLISPDTFEGTLRAAGLNGGQAVLELDTVGGVVARLAGFTSTNAGVSWGAEPGDTVHLGGKLFWLPSELLTALAVASAVEAVPEAATVPEALSSLIGCDQLGTALASVTDPSGTAFDDCDAGCVGRLCKSALETLWARARDSSASTAAVATLSVAAAGTAAIDEEARPTAVDGSWVGTVDLGSTSLSIAGPAVAGTSQPQ